MDHPQSGHRASTPTTYAAMMNLPRASHHSALAECGALNTLDADWGGKVQSRVVLLTRFTVVPHPVTALRAAHHVRARDHEGLTPATSFF